MSETTAARCQHCPCLADERSFMCEDCSSRADSEAQDERDRVEALKARLRQEVAAHRMTLHPHALPFTDEEWAGLPRDHSRVRGGAVSEDVDISRLTGIKRAGVATIATYKRLLRFDPCAYCGTRPPVDLGWEIDHIVPRASGGPDHWSNYTSACTTCNQIKTASPLLEALVQINFELPEFIADYIAEARAA